MKKSFHIFQRDLSRLLHNKAAILVLIGACLPAFSIRMV